MISKIECLPFGVRCQTLIYRKHQSYRDHTKVANNMHCMTVFDEMVWIRQSKLHSSIGFLNYTGKMKKWFKHKAARFSRGFVVLPNIKISTLS